MSSPADNILKNFNLFIETVGYAGNIEELQLPALKIKKEDHRVGGLDTAVPIDMGMEPLEASFTLTSADPVALSSIGTAVKPISITARGALQNADRGVTEVVVKMTGMVTAYEPGAWKAGEKVTTKFTMSLTYYHYIQGGVPYHLIDVKNMVRIIAGGLDQLADIRKAIGVEATPGGVMRNVIGV